MKSGSETKFYARVLKSETKQAKAVTEKHCEHKHRRELSSKVERNLFLRTYLNLVCGGNNNRMFYRTRESTYRET